MACYCDRKVIVGDRTVVVHLRYCWPMWAEVISGNPFPVGDIDFPNSIRDIKGRSRKFALRIIRALIYREMECDEHCRKLPNRHCDF
jgi:hypothetical protein